MPIVASGLGTITKWLVKELEDLEIREVENIKTISLFGSARILRAGRLEEIPCQSKSNVRPLTNADVKNSQRSKTIKFLSLDYGDT